MIIVIDIGNDMQNILVISGAGIIIFTKGRIYLKI